MSGLIGVGGALYGTTSSGGQHNLGTIFRRDPNGAVTTLHHFDGPTGAGPMAALLYADDGNFYGTTSGGGEFGHGTVYRMTPQGDVTVLFSFDGGADGRYPTAPLIQAEDGDLYGTARHGGDANCEGGCGTVFRIDDTGFLTTLHGFDGTDGANPRAALLQADDTAIWGTTYGYSDANGSHPGSVFRMPFTGGFETVVTFNDDNGFHPASALIQASDGNVYGTFYSGPLLPEVGEGGETALGGIFRLTTGGNYSIVVSFGDSDPALPQTGVIEGPGGLLFGTSTQGGETGEGTVYAATTAGGVAVLHSLGGASGSGTFLVPLLFAPDGNVYGMTNGGGANGKGVIYRLVYSTGLLFCPDNFVRRDQMAVFLLKTIHGPTYMPPECSGDFADVTCPSLFADWIEALADEGITAGCGNGNFCPLAAVRRDQMAVFLLKAAHGAAFTPSACQGDFADVPCPSLFADWVEALADEGITAGCGAGLFCPAGAVTRAQMSVFLLKIEHGSAYTPPACQAAFADVPCPSQFADWIEQLYEEEITAGCAGP